MVSNKASQSAWIPETNVIVDNICDLTPVLLYDRMIWAAVREAIEINLSAKDALNALLDWNDKNQPKVPQKELLGKFDWGLRHFDHVPFDRRIGK